MFHFAADPPARPGDARPGIGFLYVGGPHQVHHSAPVAAALARSGGFAVRAFAASDAEAETFTRLTTALGGGAIPVERLDHRAPAAARLLPRRFHKTLHVLAGLPRLARLDAIVTAERTSSFLAAIPAGPMLIHIPHGAGDRARGFERRMRRFDHVIVAGIKDRARLIGEGLVVPDRCSVSGYVKLDALRRLHRSAPPRIFANGRPTVLYNPHFSRWLSSWHACGEALIDAFARQDRYNLIVAPHVRLFERATAEERAHWLARAVPGRIHIDLGSERSCDMTYTAAADAYVGDVSSQVYDFAAEPRPCLFLNPRGADWRDDPNYACWQFGPVLPGVDGLIDALNTADEVQPGYASVQRKAVRRAFGDVMDGYGHGATAQAAAIVAGLVGHAPEAARATRLGRAEPA